MKRTVTFVAVLILGASFGASAQNNLDVGSQGSAPNSPPGLSAQPGGSSSTHHGIANQNGDNGTLEISPQTGDKPPTGGSDEIPSNREFRPGDDTSSIDREFRPGENDNGGRRTNCIGLMVNYTSYCFKGFEEHGLEITSIDDNGPAAKAGLRATADRGGAIAAAETASALLGPMEMLTNHLFEKANLANRGDMIIAIDDQRVRSEADLNDAIAKAKPGDTLYFSVIRPLPSGDHKTLRIAVKVGKWRSGDAETCSDAAAESAQADAPR